MFIDSTRDRYPEVYAHVHYPHPSCNTPECNYTERYRLLKVFAEQWIKENIDADGSQIQGCRKSVTEVVNSFRVKEEDRVKE